MFNKAYCIKKLSKLQMYVLYKKPPPTCDGEGVEEVTSGDSNNASPAERIGIPYSPENTTP
jgi:hypothetical protein